ncbi:HNH endonuclease [Methylobacter sp. S3L5C]|nr:HNH endonuclease [Methylobacter sp. S3L5C]
MARTAKHPCRVFHCRELLDKPGYCDTHKVIAVTDSARHKISKAQVTEEYKERNRFYQRATWKQLRRAQLDSSPRCCKCKLLGKLVAASVVDHITPISIGGAALDRENVQSLCTPCHSAKTNKERKKTR